MVAACLAALAGDRYQDAALSLMGRSTAVGGAVRLR